MTDDSDEFRKWPGPISGDEVREINHLVIDRVIEACGDTPFKNFDPRDGGDWKTLEHRPDLKARRLFPTNGLHAANRVATELDRASAKRTDLQNLRMLTLRLGGERPAFDQLDDHLRELSGWASRIAEDIQRPTKRHPDGLARPILTAMHIRVTNTGAGRFDPHVHAIWHIADQDIGTVKTKLSEKFGQVWIDDEPIRSLKRAAFYIAQGIIDYRGLAHWPDAALKAVWEMAKVKMFRRAGWFAEDGQSVSTMADEDELGPESVQDGSTGHQHDLGDPYPTHAPETPQEGVLDVSSTSTPSPAWKSQPFLYMRPYRASASVPDYTVRPASPEYLDLNRYPNLGDIQTTAIAIVESEQRDFDRSARDVFATYKLELEQVDLAIRRTEAYFHLKMFHPGIGWVATPQGVAWAVKAMAALTLLKEAADLGNSELMASYRDDQRLPEHLRRK